MNTLMEAWPSLVILIIAVLTLRYLRRRNGPRGGARSVLIIFTLLLSTALITGAIGTGAALRAAAPTTIAHNLGAIDETVASAARR